MERKIPSTVSDEISLYMQTMYSLLRTTAEVQIRSLEEVHAAMNSALHPHARDPYPDTSAFIYSLLRLPPCMVCVKKVVLAQSPAVFAKHGYPDIENWQPVSARARRRRCYYNGEDTLAVFIASKTDIEDVIPLLTAFQIEWNKLNQALIHFPEEIIHQAAQGNNDAKISLANTLTISLEDLDRLQQIWGDEFDENFLRTAKERCDFRVRLLSGSLSEYIRATRFWWDNIEKHNPDFYERPVYFVSSNPHSLPNLLTGFALLKRPILEKYLEDDGDPDLRIEWQDIQAKNVPSNIANFLYYVLKKYQQTEKGKYLIQEQWDHEKSCGITRIPSEHSFDVEAQVIDLSKLQPDSIDKRLCPGEWDFLKRSNALILNIDYPLGLAAFNILNKVAEHIGEILGVYIMGKAATLNGILGDVMIPTVVHDEHSHNTYMFRNAFTAADVTPYLVYGSVLDNQKAVTVLGTFIQNARVMDVIYHEGYTDIEMEAGPYLSSVYEMFRPKRHPWNEIISLHRVPFDIGILHYASDTPMSKGKNLGAGALSYHGMDSTYAASLAILRRILHLESSRLI